MTDDELKESIKKEEGLKLNVYRDQFGNLTVGYGHLLRVGSVIPIEVAEILFEADYQRACKEYDSLALSLDPVRRGVIIDMIFNIGINGVMKFTQMLNHLRDKNWIRAAYELMDSAYGSQVPNRANRNKKRILKGVW